MRIAYITPGSGGAFYCQNCLRDISLVGEMRAQGHDAVVIPLYLPLLDSEEIERESQVFFGAVNVYLSQICSIFRHTPRWFDRLFDTPAFLRFIAGIASSTRAEGMEELTMSMLRGKDGNQAKELNRLVRWLTCDFRPDIIHLSNALLIGLAPELRARAKVPLVCSLQDEDVWIESMNPEYVKLVYDMLSANVSHVDSFICVSRYYERYISRYINFDSDRMCNIYPGMDFEGYELSPRSFNPPVLGFLSRLSEKLGLGILVDAFCELKKDKRLADLRLHLAGGRTDDDSNFIGEMYDKLSSLGYGDDVEIYNSQSREERLGFLKTLTVMCVPIPKGEAFGMFILEANACGVPVVQPDAGAFAEVLDKTEGGLIYNPESHGAIVDTLSRILLDPQELIALGNTGRNNVVRYFSIEKSARETISLYKSLRRNYR